jgi:hypothetical protein
MLRSLKVLEEEYRNAAKKSKKECSNELEEIRQLSLNVMQHVFIAYRKCCSPNGKNRMPKYFNSLVDSCFLELPRISGHILFLVCNGLYRSAFDDIRYILESIVQALYIDLRHPKIDLATKIEILKEVEDKREYHAIRLIDELEIDHKDKLRKGYKNLSKIIHPSHRQYIATITDVIANVSIVIDCKEISRIHNSMKEMYDIFFFLFLIYFPEVKKQLQKNPDFMKLVKVYNLTLLSKVFKVRM